MELFSRRFFKENFFEFLLELGSVSGRCVVINVIRSNQQYCYLVNSKKIMQTKQFTNQVESSEH